MFEAIDIRELDSTKFDLGALAEAMVFYGNVRVSGNNRVFELLIGAMGPDLFLEYINRGYLEYLHEIPGSGVLTHNSGTPNEIYYIATYLLPEQSFERIASAAYAKITGKSTGSMAWASRAKKLIKFDRKLQGMSSLSSSDIRNNDFMNLVFKTMIKNLAPSYPLKDVHFELRMISENEFRVFHNLNLELLNMLFCAYSGNPDGNLNISTLLSYLAGSNGDLFRSAERKSDILCSPLSSQIIELRFDAVNKSLNSIDDVKSFQNFTVEGMSIGNAIRSGERNFKDLLILLASAERFKQWLRKEDFSTNIIKEYISAIQKESWVESTPLKLLRWAVIAFGITKPALAAGISFLDSFIISAFSKGWKPNQFVNGPLQDFVKP